MFKKALKKIFRRKLEIELINETGIDLDLKVKFKNKDSVQITVLDKSQEDYQSCQTG